MLLSQSAIADVLEVVRGRDYYLPKHQLIHEAIVELYSRGEPVDVVTVQAELESRQCLRKIGGGTYLFDLIQVVPMAGNAANYADMVREKSRLRGLSELGVRLQHLAITEGHDSSELIAQAHTFFREADESESGATRFDDLIDAWEKWDENANDVILTPWPEVNSWLNGGLAKGRLVTIGGRPSVGKSLGGLNIAAHAAENGHPAIFFSLEMGREEVATRILACGGSADMGELMRRQLTRGNWERVKRYIEENRNIPLWVDDRERVTVEQIGAKCRSIPGLELAVVDYLQLVTASDTKVSREQQVAHISRSLKILARELGISVVVAAQLNRGPVRDGKPRDPTIADLRESGAVEQDSDQVLLLHRENDDEGFVRLICGKNRIGRTGSCELKFEGKYARLRHLTEEDECLREIGY